MLAVAGQNVETTTRLGLILVSQTLPYTIAGSSRTTGHSKLPRLGFLPPGSASLPLGTASSRLARIPTGLLQCASGTRSGTHAGHSLACPPPRLRAGHTHGIATAAAAMRARRCAHAMKCMSDTAREAAPCRAAASPFAECTTVANAGDGAPRSRGWRRFDASRLSCSHLIPTAARGGAGTHGAARCHRNTRCRFTAGPRAKRGDALSGTAPYGSCAWTWRAGWRRESMAARVLHCRVHPHVRGWAHRPPHTWARGHMTTVHARRDGHSFPAALGQELSQVRSAGRVWRLGGRQRKRQADACCRRYVCC
jgi:hypothetical protein